MKLSTPPRHSVHTLKLKAASNQHSRKDKPFQTDLIFFTGRNALHTAAEANNTNELHELMEDGVSSDELNEQDENGNTPLHLAVLNGALGAVRLLLGKSATDWRLSNYDQKTPRQLSVHPHITRELDKKEGHL